MGNLLNKGFKHSKWFQFKLKNNEVINVKTMPIKILKYQEDGYVQNYCNIGDSHKDQWKKRIKIIRGRTLTIIMTKLKPIEHIEDNAGDFLSLDPQW